MKKLMQRAVSLGVFVLSIGVASLNTAGAASGPEPGQAVGSLSQGQAGDSLAAYRVNQQNTILQGKTIVVDPGHGGSDTGAIGPGDTMEKQVTLAVAQELRKLLADGGATVIMTRSSDSDVAYDGASDIEELATRVGIANKANADLFVSIHADSFAGSAGGTTTYFSDDSRNNDHIAQLVQDNLVAQLHLYDRGIQQQDYYVLEHADMPAILTEIAFISDPQEEKLLASRNFDRRAALGIFAGIAQYFQVS